MFYSMDIEKRSKEKELILCLHVGACIKIGVLFATYHLLGIM